MQEFMEACNGFDQVLSLEVLRSWQEGVCMVNNLRLGFNAASIIKAIRMQNVGKELKREIKLNKL